MITLGSQGKNTFLEAVNIKSGANVLECYQCGKCVSTCPVSQYMDFPPREIMQMIKLGLKEECYMANSHWFCLTCSACSGRCPREIDIPAVMEAVRFLVGMGLDLSHMQDIIRQQTEEMHLHMAVVGEEQLHCLYPALLVVMVMME